MKAALLPLLAASLTLAACVSSVEAPRTASTAPVPRPSPSHSRPAPAPLPAAPSTGWMDAALTTGAWRYERTDGGQVAVFVTPRGEGEFVMSCDRARGRIDLWRAGTSPAPKVMTIRTETATRAIQVVQAEDTNPYFTADLPARDPLLDAMALSKGRFAVEVEGEAPLIMPSWAEVSRVIEDCR